VASKKSFPDLNKDGKVTKADILKGRGVEGFREGGSVRRPAPVEEPISDDPLIQALEDERRIQEANEPNKNKNKNKTTHPGRPGGESGERNRRFRGYMHSSPPPKVDRIAPKSEDTRTFAEGGMVRGCKGIQMKGKKFSGTY
jgi:hypothetical protein